MHTNIIGDIESGIQQHLTVVDRLLQRMDGLGSYVGVGVRVGMYFCKYSGIHFNIHNNQPHVIDDTLYHEIRKQSTMSGGIAGRDIMRILGVLDAVAENSGIAITVC